MNHKTNCSINKSCAVYHVDGKCNHPTFGKCDCGFLPNETKKEECDANPCNCIGSGQHYLITGGKISSPHIPTGEEKHNEDCEYIKLVSFHKDNNKHLCSCDSIASTGEDWEKEFDKKFTLSRVGIIENRPSYLGSKYHDDFNIVKDFIRQLLLSKEKEIPEKFKVYLSYLEGRKHLFQLIERYPNLIHEAIESAFHHDLSDSRPEIEKQVREGLRREIEKLKGINRLTKDEALNNILSLLSNNQEDK